ncbi:hypothetical protein [Botrimarina sp.]|uniref:hypothetical protein n=1 Tax=Botrimarina sp. TaxID=2795802 RepID=UPI0032F0396D
MPSSRRNSTLAASLAILAWLAAGPACAQAPPPTLEALLDGAKRLLESQAEPEPLPAPANPTPAEERFHLPIRAVDGDVDVTSDRGLVSLSVRDASLRQVLTAIAETQGRDLIVAAPADVPVTAEFNRKPVEEVLAALLHSTGHSWTMRDGVIVVTSLAEGGALSFDAQGRRVAVIELDFASSADLQPAVEGLLSPVGQSYYVESDPTDNRRTKELLIVEDLAPYVQRVERYVAEADQPPRQVLIEAHLLQVNLDDEQRCGVNLDALSRVSGAELRLQSVGLANAAASPGFFVESTGGDLEGLIEALIATTDAKAIASPRLLAVNGQEAHLQIGEKLGYRLTTTTQTASTESVNFLEVGVVLRLTPRITRDGRVLLRVAPKVSSGAINADTGVPDEETTELQTDALLNSGQGMVIGGLIQERDDTRISRIPFLGSLPYVNPLFQRREVVKSRSELIVALVPHVLPYDPAMQCRNEEEFARVTDPLVYGPLCRYPRPYEPRLADPYVDEPRLHLFDRRDPECPVPGSAADCTDGPADDYPLRLPPVADGATAARQTRVAQEANPTIR